MMILCNIVTYVYFPDWRIEAFPDLICIDIWYVPDLITIFTVSLYYYVGVQELRGIMNSSTNMYHKNDLRGDHLWGEWSPWILEYDADNVITNMSFSAQLLLLSCAKINNKKTLRVKMKNIKSNLNGRKGPTWNIIS